MAISAAEQKRRGQYVTDLARAAAVLEMYGRSKQAEELIQIGDRIYSGLIRRRQ